VRGQGEAEISLRKGRHRGAEGGGKITGRLIRNANWEESSFVIVDRKTSGTFKKLKDSLSMKDSFSGRFDEDKSVVGVLKNWARFVRNKRMLDRGS
jgi:hypothetical protein